MKHNIRKRNIRELNGEHKKIGNICGYDIYIPAMLFNPISYLKENCPVWIKISEDGECHVIFLKGNDSNANENEIRDYILNNLPPKPYISCRNIQRLDCHPLSCEAFNDEGVICGKIIIKKSESDNLLIVESISYDNDDTLQKLRQHLLSEHNIQSYPAVILQFNIASIHKHTIDLLGAIYDESRNAYILQLI